MAFVNSYDETSVRIRALREGHLRRGLREQWLYDETLRGTGRRHYDGTETDEIPSWPDFLSGQRCRGFVTGQGGFVVVAGGDRD
jgi:hypothetical protein